MPTIPLTSASQQAQQDDFSWDDEPEETPAPKSAVPAKVTASSSTSPRDSEESYDLVSDQGVKPQAKPAAAAATANDDEDSDWE